MQSLTKKAAAISALLLAAGVADASIIVPTDAAGSEMLLNIVNKSNNASYTLDLGVQAGALAGGTYNLDAGAQSFIAGAGGLAGVQFSVIGGGGAGATNNSFVSSSANDLTAITAPGNGTQGQWKNLLLDLIGPMNAGDPSPVTDDNGYGAFAAGALPNYDFAGGPLWQSSNSAINNLFDATGPVSLFNVAFGSNAFAKAVITDTGLDATLSLNALSITPIPVPAAAWLFGSALGLLGWVRGRASRS